MTCLVTVRRTLAAATVAPVLLTGLIACGGGSVTDAAGSDTSQSAPATGGELERGDSVEPADFTEQIESGLEKITTAHTAFEAELGTAGAVSGEGDVDFTADPPSVAMTMDADSMGGDLEVRVVDGVGYVRIGDLNGGMFWKLDLDSPDSPFGAMGSQLDPRALLEKLAKGLDSVTYVGEEDVAGQSLHHYRATLDGRALLDEMGPRAGAPALPDSLDYDIWLDEQDRPANLAFEMGSMASVEMSLSEWGEDVSIEAPPADQVTEMPDVFSGAFSEPQV